MKKIFAWDVTMCLILLFIGLIGFSGCSTWQQDKVVTQQDLSALQVLFEETLVGQDLETAEAVRKQVAEIVEGIPADASKDEQVQTIVERLPVLLPEPVSNYGLIGLAVYTYLQRRKAMQLSGSPPGNTAAS